MPSLNETGECGICGKNKKLYYELDGVKYCKMCYDAKNDEEKKTKRSKTWDEIMEDLHVNKNEKGDDDTTNEDDDTYECDGCGSKLSEGQKYCPSCGLELKW